MSHRIETDLMTQIAKVSSRPGVKTRRSRECRPSDRHSVSAEAGSGLCSSGVGSRPRTFPGRRKSDAIAWPIRSVVIRFVIPQYLFPTFAANSIGSP